MGKSPVRSNLYRTAALAVISAALLLLAAGTLSAQFAQKAVVSKGPRALGLLMMPPKGKPRLIPIAIMVDGRFYDAGAYKANPVPMALEPGTVYEAERAGDSLGLFTVGQVLQQKNNWLAEGTYHLNGEQVASSAHRAETTPRPDKDEGPPVLRRPGSQSPAPKPPAADSKPASSAPESKPASKPAPESTATSAPPAQSEPPSDDPNIPKLRRGKPDDSQVEQQSAPAPPSAAKPTKPAANETKTGMASSPQAAEVQYIPAISDADGPEPRSYSYDLKPDEEQAFRTKMLALAAEELRKQVKEFQPAKLPPTVRRRPNVKTSKTPQPSFDDVHLRVYDLSSSNEPVLVLTATAHPPQSGSETAKSGDYYVTLAARSDIYNELRKLFSSITDSQHLDVNPRLEVIDAVDADGDGRGDLLFRQTGESGSAYTIYRVLPDRFWALYEGTPQ